MGKRDGDKSGKSNGWMTTAPEVNKGSTVAVAANKGGLPLFEAMSFCGQKIKLVAALAPPRVTVACSAVAEPDHAAVLV